jgi:hypothetical protein
MPDLRPTLAVLGIIALTIGAVWLVLRLNLWMLQKKQEVRR